MDKKKTNEEFINEIRGIDFSFDAKEKDTTQIKLINKLVQSQEENYMKKSKFNTRVAVAALSMVVLFSSIAYGGQIVNFIKQQITLGGHATYTQFDEDYLTTLEPADISELSDDMYVAVKEDGGERVRDYVIEFANLEDAAPYFIADILTPSYIPEGYEFSFAEIYKDENGEAQKDTKYINWTYSNGSDEINVMARYLDHETSFESGLTDNYEMIQVNGYDVLIDGRCVDIAVDGVIYSFFSDNTAETVKMVESMFQ